MGGDHGNAHAGQDRGAGGRHDAVGGGGGNAHAQDQAADHGQQQAQEKFALGDGHNGVDDRGGQAGDRQAAADHTGNAAGHGHGHAVAAAVFQGLEDVDGLEHLPVGFLRLLPEGFIPGTELPVGLAHDDITGSKPYHHGNDGGVHQGGHRFHPQGQQQVHQDREGQEVRLVVGGGVLRRGVPDGLAHFQVIGDEPHHDGGNDGPGGGRLHGHGLGADQVNQDGQGQQQVAFLHQVLQAGQLAFAQALEAQALRLQVHRQEHAQEVQAGRQDGPDDDVRIGHAQVVRHEEGRRAHDGGHDLPAGGGRGLHRAGEVLVIPGLFHHGNGNGARGHRVAHGGAGHHAAQGRGNHRHLGRAAGVAAGEAVGQFNEEPGDAGLFQEGPEDDEHHNVFGAYIDGGGKDAVLVVEQLMDDAGQHFPAGDMPVDGIPQENKGHAEDREAHAAAAELRQHQQAHDARDDVHRVLQLRLQAGVQQGMGVEGIVEEGRRAQEHQEDVIPGHSVDLHPALPSGVNQEAGDDHQPQEGAEAHLLEEIGEQRHIDTEQGKGRQHDAHQDLRHAFPHAGIGFPVILPHNSVHVSGC